MKVGVKVALAVTAWLLILVPLGFKTLLVSRAALDLDELQRYEELGTSNILAYIPISVHGEQLPDIAEATELVLNRKLVEYGSNRRFIVSAACTSESEVCVDVTVDTHDVIGLNKSSSHLDIRVSHKTVAGGQASEIVSLLLFDHLYKDEFEPQAEMHPEVTVSYSPKFHLAFSLLSEGGATLDWDIAEALNRYMAPLLNDINSSIASLSIDAQTGSFAALGCERTSVIAESELSTFVDFAEWSLASILPYPTLNFVLYVPSSELRIGDGKTNSFVVPQWGGVYVAAPHDTAHFFAAEDLEEVLQRFSAQLLAILGMRKSNEEYTSSVVRLRKLARAYTLGGVKHAMASLGSLRRLAINMPQIAIPQKVAERVDTAVAAIEGALRSLEQGDLKSARRFTAMAYESAERAFFDKHMIAQAYFPDDQKLAVYMPLIGPLCIVVLSCWFRFFKQRRNNPPKGEPTNKETAEKKKPAESTS